MEHRGCKIYVYLPRYCKGKKSPNFLHAIAEKKSVLLGRSKKPSWKSTLSAGASVWCVDSARLLPLPHALAFWRQEHWIPDANSCDSFVSSDSDCWSTVVTCELPCQCVNTGYLNWQKRSSKYLPATSQPTVRLLSILFPPGVRGSWKRIYKHCEQTEHASKSLPCLKSVCFGLSESMKHTTDTDDLHVT